jgi:serine phosphatase RsbU (regulator of sigma subunit)/CHASE3 domain sensor protein/anti-sigma regulatory factor (Ser/Thr protein kinase)
MVPRVERSNGEHTPLLNAAQDGPTPVIGRKRVAAQALYLSAVPLFFLVLLLALALIVQTHNASIAAQSEHLGDLLSASDRATQLLANAGNAIVVYNRTRKESALRPYVAARRDMPEALSTLANAVRDDPPQREKIAKLSADFNEGLAILKAYLALVRSRNVTAQLALAESPRVRALSEDLNARSAAFNLDERTATSKTLDASRDQVQKYTVGLVAICLLGILVTVAISIRFGLGITRRILLLAENARKIARGEEPQSIGGSDEIAQLDGVYREMTQHIRREQDRVLTLQRALLPQQLPLLPGIRLDVAYTSASAGTEVGGDWYDVFRISERRVGISIGDVAGHGLRAAAIMGNARQAIRTIAYINDDPATVVGHVNRVLCRNESGVLITGFYGTFDLLDGLFRYCIAGHPNPMVVRTGGSVETLPGNGFVFGVDPRATYENFETVLEIGSAVVLFTDGLVESERDYVKGVETLKEAIEEEYRNASHNIAEAIQNRIFATSPPHDDAAVLFLGVTTLGASAVEPKRLTWHLDARSEKSARRVKRALLWHLGEVAGDADLSGAELVLSELLGNVARHTPGPADVALEWRDGEATIRVYDQGPRFEPPADNHTADLLSEGGRGLFLVRSIAREFGVDWTGDGNRTFAVMSLGPHGYSAASTISPPPARFLG